MTLDHRPISLYCCETLCSGGFDDEDDSQLGPDEDTNEDSGDRICSGNLQEMSLCCGVDFQEASLLPHSGPHLIKIIKGTQAFAQGLHLSIGIRRGRLELLLAAQLRSSMCTNTKC